MRKLQGDLLLMAQDPICGMEVDEKKAKLSTAKNGKKYYFCSKNCYDKFLEKEKAPILKKTIKKMPIENKTIIKKKSIKNNKNKESKKIETPIKKETMEKQSIKNDKTKSLKEHSIENKKNELIKNNKAEIKKIILPIRGMHCASCALNIEKKLKSWHGVVNAEVSYAAGRASVEYNPKKTSDKKLVETINKMG